MKMTRNTTKNLNVGLFLNRQHGKELLDAIWFDEYGQAYHVLWDMFDRTQSLENLIRQVGQYSDKQKLELKLITAALPNQLWNQTLFLPDTLNEQECEQQCEFFLQRDLPISLEEVWYDYCASHLKGGTRLDIFAIMRKVAEHQIMMFEPFGLDVLDSAIYAIERAYRFILKAQFNDEAAMLYQDELYSLAVQRKGQQLRVLQLAETSLSELYEQFCARYQDIPEYCYAYSATNASHSSDWQLIETDLPLMALGAALWTEEPENKNVLQLDLEELEALEELEQAGLLGIGVKH
ncbi:pilus assembly protein PilM [Pasteurella bettyae]|uniref:Competence protein A domain protein n=1 Tax=Pasteurella bettyae CCUG 2042 TaxID=1095749 RepID=I3D6A6_9PAST|nr:pilus assembly protein PilM [Pasteurella bettyae]EIJ67249.1 competence protein A domain protein [Pasteurella bettyae CCUG 2042]SUB21281.1 competence protein A [Pasteurella bettyae]